MRSRRSDDIRFTAHIGRRGIAAPEQPQRIRAESRGNDVRTRDCEVPKRIGSAAMDTCRSCGADNPEGQRFCGGCGAALGAPAASLPEERKVVTALFCDLVGFTAASEAADPEDI